MRHISVLFVLASLVLVAPLDAADTLSLVPRPRQLKLADEAPFIFNAQTRIRHFGEGSKPVAEQLAITLRRATGLPLPVIELQSKLANTIDLLLYPAGHEDKRENYRLIARALEVRLEASSPGGLFNATRTLLQLLPSEVFASTPVAGATWNVPAVTIADAPVFKWRGMMLDVSRYFFTKEYVMRYLDMMALHKMNVLHWHLVDDAGWRIEIKKFPKLTEIGGFRGQGGKRYGGFYTQEDIREIVAYAAARNITIVPEIELPAHTLPALVAYPELGCTGKQFKVPSRHSISPELYCAGKESTWEFLEQVMTEVCELFPGTYIHIGGDEARFQRWKACPDCQAKMKELKLKSEHELQGWMTTRIEKFLKTKNKRIIGWDEILGAGVSPSAGIMTWHRPKTAVEGAKRGNPVVMSLTGHAYFDVAESKLPGEPPTANWIPPISLKKAYSWDPLPKGLTGEAANNILGASACVWSDQFLHKAEILADKKGQGTKASEAYIDYLTLPRLAALSEVTWTPLEMRDYADFSERMRQMYDRYDILGYQYRVPVPEFTIGNRPDKSLLLSATPAIASGHIRYTLDGSTPDASSKLFGGELTLKTLTGFRAATFTAGDKRQSLTFLKEEPAEDFAKLGEKIGEWKAGEIGDRKAKEASFDATGLIDGNGDYIITFVYTGGKYRLMIDGIEMIRNDTVPVGNDIHKGSTGSKHNKNSYRIKVRNYQTGASFKVNAMIYGDEGSDSNGVVLIRKAK